MEKESITIEIKQEVSITLLWIAAGVILVSATFFLTPQTTELWPAINTAGIAATLYFVALMAYVLRKPLAAKWRMIFGVISIVVIGCGAYRWMGMQEETHWQVDLLMKIRAVIGRGISISEMPPMLLKTLDLYYRQDTKGAKTLAELFKQLHPGATVGTNIHKAEGEWDKTTVMVETLEPYRIVLLSQETFVPGRDSSFKNYNGQTGMLQERFILTKKGLTHVSEN